MIAIMQKGNSYTWFVKILIFIFRCIGCYVDWYYFEEDVDMSQEQEDLKQFYKMVIAVPSYSGRQGASRSRQKEKETYYDNG